MEFRISLVIPRNWMKISTKPTTCDLDSEFRLVGTCLRLKLGLSQQTFEIDCMLELAKDVGGLHEISVGKALGEGEASTALPSTRIVAANVHRLGLANACAVAHFGWTIGH
jgi:hypothetical protein